MLIPMRDSKKSTHLQSGQPPLSEGRSAASMGASPTNLFHVLGLNYEMFHSRMLKWLWTADADHGAGARFLVPFLQTIGLHDEAKAALAIEVKIDVPGGPRWRLADIVIRTAGHMVLVENKVDPAYQDLGQVRDEIAGGGQMAEAEGRKLVYVLIAPGPITMAIAMAVSEVGQFVRWDEVINLIRSTMINDLDPFVQAVIRQYADFMQNPALGPRPGALSDPALRQCEDGICELLDQLAPGTELTAVEIWKYFVARFPDHVAALEDRYAEMSHYSAKAWFSARLQRMAANRCKIEDTGEWRTVRQAWGFPKSARLSSDSGVIGAVRRDGVAESVPTWTAASPRNRIASATLVPRQASGNRSTGQERCDVPMEPTTLICSVCGATAQVVSTHPRFDSVMYSPGAGGKFQQVLRETRYVIECPKCGRRDQIVKAVVKQTNRSHRSPLNGPEDRRRVLSSSANAGLKWPRRRSMFD